jgi:two-component system, chemotaxis family, protein-glutamate methylesterase/glutaminase
MRADGRRLRVLVVEDSAVARRHLVHILSSDPELRVIAEAENGDQAVQVAAHRRPDVIVMDVVMPSMDGLEATRRIMEMLPTPIVLVSATYSADDLSRSFEALRAGALTLVAKPCGAQASAFADEAAALTTTVKLMAQIRLVRRRPAVASAPPPTARRHPTTVGARGQAPRLVAVAASTGGPAALAAILGRLSRATPVPILVVQHITPGFDRGLVDWLTTTSPMPVRLARDSEPLRAGEVLVAPSDAHLGVTGKGRVALTADPPIRGHRPSATHLFRTVADVYGAAAVGVILTGMGEDGVAGLRVLKDAGGLVLAQDESTSVVYGMPGKAASLGIVDHVLPLDEIAGAVTAAVDGRT